MCRQDDWARDGGRGAVEDQVVGGDVSRVRQGQVRVRQGVGRCAPTAAAATCERCMRESCGAQRVPGVSHPPVISDKPSSCCQLKHTQREVGLRPHGKAFWARAPASLGSCVLPQQPRGSCPTGSRLGIRSGWPVHRGTRDPPAPSPWLRGACALAAATTAGFYSRTCSAVPATGVAAGPAHTCCWGHWSLLGVATSARPPRRRRLRHPGCILSEFPMYFSFGSPAQQ
jgi:hypothetical protein